MRSTASVAALMLLVTACSGEPSPTPGSAYLMSAPQPHVASWVTAHGPRLLFAGTYDSNAVGRIDIYDGDTFKLVGQSTNVKLPLALAVDSHGSLYESDEVLHAIQIFRAPYMQPSAKLQDSGFIPYGLHVDRAGNVWVANICALKRSNCGGPGDVIEFPHGSATPVTLNGGPAAPVDVTTDAAGDVWADGTDGAGNCIVGEWLHGSGRFVPSGIKCNDTDPNGNRPGWVTFDLKGNLWLGYTPNNHGVLGVFAPGQTTPRRSIVVNGQVIGFALDRSEEDVFVVDFNGFKIRAFSNPQGHLIRFIGNSSEKSYSVALLPAPPP